MKKNVLALSVVFMAALQPAWSQTPIQLTYDLSAAGKPISPTLYGVFFEDINHAAEGGLYGELIRNRSFEDSLHGWQLSAPAGAAGTMLLHNGGLLNSIQKKCLQVTAEKATPAAKLSIINNGFWGINVMDKTRYELSFFAKAAPGFTGSVTASLVNKDGSVIYAKQTVAKLTGVWKKYTCTLVASGNDALARFSLTIDAPGTVYFDVVSLFPPTYKNRKNGMRIDLAKRIEALRPRFFRFPGGCYIEGDTLKNRFQWKNSVGRIEERPSQKTFWGYSSDNGMGFHECLQFSEDLGAEPLYVANIGVAHKDFVPSDSLEWYLQDALDALEYANGPVTSRYGAMRAANGHAKPFNIKYFEIGNENWFRNNYYQRYMQFYNAVKKKYPNMVCIANTETWGGAPYVWDDTKPADLVDEHYYMSPDWFAKQAERYDAYKRNNQIYVGEYAVVGWEGGGRGNLRSAVAEAIFMTGLEKNSDLVRMASYAPLFANVNSMQWNPNAIYFNASSSYGSPSYHVQRMFAANIGDTYIPVKASGNAIPWQSAYSGNFGLETTASQFEFDDVHITAGNATIADETFSTPGTQWEKISGNWEVNNGVLQQTGAREGRIILGNITATAYTLQLRARKTGGGNQLRIIFGRNAADNYCSLNLGMSNNTRAAIAQVTPGGRTVGKEEPFKFSDGRWYAIKIEVNGDTVRSYVDDKLIASFVTSHISDYLHTSCTVDRQGKNIYLKVVNYGDKEQDATINLTGLSAATLNGTVETLTYNDGKAENSIAQPDKIQPEMETLQSQSASFTRRFPAMSVTVLHLNPLRGK